MQKLDDHDLDVIVQVRKFGERFDIRPLSAALESLAGGAWNRSCYMLHISLQSA